MDPVLSTGTELKFQLGFTDWFDFTLFAETLRHFFASHDLILIFLQNKILFVKTHRARTNVHARQVLL